MEQNKGSWGSLPEEIRLMILENLLHDGCSLANLATVSREWQTIIEKHNFARIKVTLPRLLKLKSMVHRNRALVRYIWLCIRLPDYDDCEICEPYDLGLHGYPNMIIMCDGVLYYLFSALGEWEPRGSLVVDISFYSPGDSKHWFPEITVLPDMPTMEECEQAFCATRQAKLARPEDDKHGWTGGDPPPQAIVRVFEDIALEKRHGVCPLENWWTLLHRSPPAITGLLLRQQNRRRLNPLEIRSIWEYCGGLQEAYYEPWREWADHHQSTTDSDYADAFIFPFPDQLKKLVLFENFDERIPTHFTWPCQPIRVASRTVSENVASNSLALEHLSASFMVDAAGFLGALQPGWTWPNLKTLALTSVLLTPKDFDPDGVDRMLKDAAAAAARMPNLETMEIWNGRKGVAGLFRYRSARRGGTAGITWRGTWDLTVSKDVFRAWAAVMHKGEDSVYGYRRSRLVVVKEALDAGKIRFHGDAIHHLGLEAQVMRPVSLYQMRMERDIRESKE